MFSYLCLINTASLCGRQLAEWLYFSFTFYLHDRCSLPLMGLAAKQNGQLEKLKDEKISDRQFHCWNMVRVLLRVKKLKLIFVCNFDPA